MRRFVLGTAAVLAIAAVVLPTAFAGKWVNQQKVPFYNVAACSSDNVITTGSEMGFAQLVDPMGSVAMIVNGHTTGLSPLTSYDVWVRELTNYTGDSLYAYPPLSYYKLGTFTTDEYGVGDFHLNLMSADLPDGTYHIQVAINNSGAPDNIGCTYIATAKFASVTVHS